MEAKHLINLQGRQYVTYEGLLDTAHAKGLSGIRTTLVQAPTEANGNTAIVHAVAEFADGREFHGIGDASPKNVSRGIVPHLIRMSETRAKARAMRDGTNIGMTAFEELDVADLPREQGDTAAPAEPANPTAPATDKEIGQLWAALRDAYGDEAESTWREHIKVYTNPDGSPKTSTKQLTSAEARAATAHYIKEARKGA